MDMMRPVTVYVDRALPQVPVVTANQNPSTGAITVVWTDGTVVSYNNLATWWNIQNEVGFRIERAEVAADGRVGVYVPLTNALANQTQFIDNTAVLGVEYSYRVVAYNAAGEAASLSTLVSLPIIYLPLLHK